MDRETEVAARKRLDAAGTNRYARRCRNREENCYQQDREQRDTFFVAFSPSGGLGSGELSMRMPVFVRVFVECLFTAGGAEVERVSFVF